MAEIGEDLQGALPMSGEAGRPRRMVPVGYVSRWALERMAQGKRASLWALKRGLGTDALAVYVEEASLPPAPEAR